MKAGEKLKRTYITDAVVIGLIIIGGVIFSLTIGKPDLGWEVKGDRVVVENEEKDLAENVVVHENGELLLTNSLIHFEPKSNLDLNFYIEGDSALKAEESEINSDFLRYAISANKVDGKSPEIKLYDTKISSSVGLFLWGRSKLEAENSNIGLLIPRERASASLQNTRFSLRLFASEFSELSGLNAGERVSLNLEKEDNWKIEAVNSEVLSYQIVVKSAEKIKIVDSQNIILSLVSEGIDEPMEADLSKLGLEKLSGNLDLIDAGITWDNSGIKGLDFVFVESDKAVLKNGNVTGIALSGNSDVTIEGAMLSCDVCSLYSDSRLILSNINISQETFSQPLLVISGNSSVVIKDSDISNLYIHMSGPSTLETENCVVDKDKIITGSLAVWENHERDDSSDIQQD